jgi:benzylsuccinate CoA-transferase BbsF subunit
MNVFDGIKILDFSWVLAGPLASGYLAKHGATVVKIEGVDRPDLLRTSGPYKDGISGVNRSGMYATINSNKLSMGLNLKHPKGIEVAKKLVAWADVVNENFTPGSMEGWGLGYEDLKKIKEDVIMLRSSNQGQTGPHATRRGFGIQLVSQVGFNSVTGWPDRGPTSSYIGYTDFVAPRFAAIALITALIYRHRTGKGLCIDISQLEACEEFLAPLILDYTVNGREPHAVGNVCAYAVPHGAFRCKGIDRWCAISVFTDKEWKAFCDASNHPEWMEDPKFAELSSRKNHEDELNNLIEEWTLSFEAEEIMNLLQEAGVPAGVVKNGQDLLDDPQLNFRNHVWWLQHEEIGLFPHMGAPIVLSETPAEARMPSPLLGGHTEYVCREILKLPDEEFVMLLSEGVFG